MSANTLAVLAVVVVSASIVFWAQRANAVRAGEVRGIVIGAMALAALLAISALILGAGLAGKIGAGLALALSGTFLGLQLISGQSKDAPTVGVGERILEFSAPDDSGETFSSASLAGKPYLLKFFRGHW